jgi:putative endonuclease
MKTSYVYMLICADNSLYTGVSDDPDRRVSEHNAGRRGAKALRGRRPVRLLRRWLCKNRPAALALEAALKKLRAQEKWSVILSNDSKPSLLKRPHYPEIADRDRKDRGFVRTTHAKADRGAHAKVQGDAVVERDQDAERNGEGQ